MKFFTRVILLGVLFCCSVQLFSQAEYSTIHFLPTKVDKAYAKYFVNLNFKLYINDKLVTSVDIYNDLKIKVYSEGRLTLTAVSSMNPAGGSNMSTVTIDITAGNEYYAVKSMSVTSAKNTFFKAVDSLQWNAYKSTITKVVEVEEDKETPYGKIDNNRKSGKGQGTCFAFTSNGYLITNYHVIENAKEITVKGIDGDYSTKYGATVIASDKTNDLALLKLGNKNIKFETIPFGIRNAGVQQGEKVYAMGFPIAIAMGNEVKLTDGIISAKSGVLGDISKFQISAAVNPGNSGGPLIDEQGNLVGVIYAKSALAESAGYAIKAGYLEAFLKNIDGFEYPVIANSLKEKSLTDKIAEMKKIIFIVETN